MPWQTAKGIAESSSGGAPNLLLEDLLELRIARSPRRRAARSKGTAGCQERVHDDAVRGVAEALLELRLRALAEIEHLRLGLDGLQRAGQLHRLLGATPSARSPGRHWSA